MKPQPKRPGDQPQDLSQQAHRRLIGALGLLLPTLLYAVAAIRPTDGRPGLTLLDSVSVYYYTGAIGIFAGVLFALSLFLFTYPGYKGVIADRVVGCLGGVAALGVALFPTAAPEGFIAPSWWSPWERVVHYTSAILLFVSFILFSIWLFRKSNVAKAKRPLDKRRRDAICLGCGIAMIVCVLWAASALFTDAPIFLPEAIAIIAFALSWLVKGEAYQPVVEAIRRMMA